MIAYFTGTGNSYQVAKTIADTTGDNLVSINDRLRSKSTEPIHSDKPLVFVTPIYSGRIPRAVVEHIKATQFNGTDKAYFVATCCQTPYYAQHHIEKLCAEKGWKLEGFSYVKMPQNYIVMFDGTGADDAKKIIDAAAPRIAEIAEAIRDGKPISSDVKGGSFMSNIINPLMYRSMNTKDFHATDACVGCGTCAKACPLANIQIVDGKPVWGSSCTQCMACIGACPKHAIEYGKKTAGKPRYWNPSYLIPNGK